MRNKTLLIAAISAITLTGCANYGTPDKDGFLMQDHIVSGKTFMVTHLNDKKLDDTLNSTMTFGNDLSITGRNFCNLYRGDYKVSYNNLLEIENTVSTMKSCLDINMSAENELLNVFKDKIVVSKSEYGYKLKSDSGSMMIMEMILVKKK